jgi:hypothetical protein
MKRISMPNFEVIGAAGVFLWGIWLLNPFVETFARWSFSYVAMARWASENAWGSGAVLIGLTSFAGMALHKKPLRYAGTLGTLAFRAFTFILIGLQTNFSAQGIPDFFLWTLITLIAFYRIDNDAR